MTVNKKDMYVGKHERIDVFGIKDAIPGPCFHGEVWVKCPYCKEPQELMGVTPIMEIDGCKMFKCSKCDMTYKER